MRCAPTWSHATHLTHYRPQHDNPGEVPTPRVGTNSLKICIPVSHDVTRRELGDTPLKNHVRQPNAGRFFFCGGAGISSNRPLTVRLRGSATSEPSTRLAGCTRCALPPRASWLPCSEGKKGGFHSTTHTLWALAAHLAYSLSSRRRTCHGELARSAGTFFSPPV